jgi:hypothetical protein
MQMTLNNVSINNISSLDPVNDRERYVHIMINPADCCAAQCLISSKNKGHYFFYKCGLKIDAKSSPY